MDHRVTVGTNWTQIDNRINLVFGLYLDNFTKWRMWIKPSPMSP